MSTVRLNITLPSDLAEVLKGIRNKSAYIAEALQEKISREKQKRLVAQLKEGYQATRKEDGELSQEWNCALGDGID